MQATEKFVVANSHILEPAGKHLNPTSGRSVECVSLTRHGKSLLVEAQKDKKAVAKAKASISRWLASLPERQEVLHIETEEDGPEWQGTLQVESGEDGETRIKKFGPIGEGLLAFVKGLGRKDTIDISDDETEAEYQFAVSKADGNGEHTCYINISEKIGCIHLYVYGGILAVDDGSSEEELQALTVSASSLCIYGRAENYEGREFRYRNSIYISSLVLRLSHSDRTGAIKALIEDLFQMSLIEVNSLAAA